MSRVQRRRYVCRGLIYPAEDVRGQWIGHCLDYDIVTQSDSPAEAFDALADAVGVTVADDLNGNFEPSDRSAPNEEWDRFYAASKRGVKMEASEAFARASKGSNGCIVVQFDVELLGVAKPDTPPAQVIPQSQTMMYDECA